MRDLCSTEKSGPNKPTVLQTVSDIGGFVREAESCVADFRRAVFGEEFDNEPAGTGLQVVVPLDAEVAGVCTRVASLVGELRTINQRFGVVPAKSR